MPEKYYKIVSELHDRKRIETYLASFLCLLLLPLLFPHVDLFFNLLFVGESLFPGARAEVGKPSGGLCPLGILLAVVGAGNSVTLHWGTLWFCSNDISTI